MIDLKEKLSSRIKVLENGCWLYTGGKQSQGYGVLWDGAKQRRAHIVSYEIHVETIPQGMLVLHECDNPWCVNPEHLFLGTHQDNVNDMRTKGRDSFGHNKGENNGQAVLNEDKVRQIRRLLKTGQYTQEQIGDMFGVTRGAIKAIKLGYTWKYLEEE